MPHEDLETRADGKADSGYKRILESDPIHVVLGGPANMVAQGLVRRQKAGQNRRVDAGSRHDLPGRAPAFGYRRRLDIRPDKPAPEPARCDVTDGRARLTVERFSNRREVHVVGDAQMVQALAHAPLVRGRLPVELRRREPGRESCCARIRVVDFLKQPGRPGRRLGHGFG